MSWSTPNQSVPQWNHVQGMGMQDMNSSSYTPEQWAMMQQQNWQQWTQWQQQYSQWHNQYGDKYAKQLQAVQSMGGVPPPPPSGAAPPPPPDKPPPPPPHENNQPLFNKAQPSTNPVPSQRNTNFPNTNSETGNNQWSYTDTQPAVNAEALKKLAEEERLFDIQFQKWEEEIEKWRQENVNHPDKQAYKDYEAKFEACRTQLLERRQQMKAKRANLLNNPAHAGANTGNTSVAPPAPKSSQNISTNTQSQNFQNKTFDRQYDSNNRNNKNVEPQDRYESYHLNMSDSDNSNQGSHKTQGNKSDKLFLPSASSGKGIPGLDLVPDTNKKPEIIDITDDPSESQKAPDYSTISMGINNILSDEKIMNILSMVRGIKPSQETDVNRVTQPPPLNNQGNRNQNFNQPQQFSNQHGNPMQQNQNQDMNSQYQQGGMYRQDSAQQDGYYDQNGSGQYGGPPPNMRGPRGPRPGGPGGPGLRQPGPGMHQGGGGMRSNGPGMQGGPGMHQSGPGMRPNGPGMQQRAPGMQQGGPGMQQGGPRMQQGGPRMQHGGPGMQQGGPRMQQGGSNMQQGGPRMQQSGPNMQQGGPRMQQGGPNMQQGGPRMQLSGPNMQQGGPRMQQGGPGMQQGGSEMQQGGPGTQQGGPGTQQGGPGMQQEGPKMQQQLPSLFQNRIAKPAMLNEQGRPPLQDMSSQQNTDFYSGPQRPAPPAPIKWVEEPLFTPSIVVEYEHKSLRLKAREFIEPVHTFDYNHVSKDGENRKKDFQHEADELFTRKPRRPERDYADDRFGRDLFQRDYERKGSRDEFRDTREPRDLREPRDIRDSRDMIDFRDMREPRDRDVRDIRDMRELRDMRDLPRDIRDVPRDMRDPPRDMRDLPRDIRDSPRDMRDSPRDIRDLPRDVRDPLREMRDPTRDIKDPLRDMREPPRDLRDSPRDVRDPPRDVRDSPRDMRDPPRDMREPREFRGRDEINSRDRPRDDYFDRRRDDRRDDDRRRDDRYPRRDDHRDRDYNRDRNGRRDDNRERRDDRKDDVSNRSLSKDKDSRKRASSHESEVSMSSKKTKNDKDAPTNKHIVMIDDLLEPPGRDMRPEKIVIILRGLPGSGKSYLAKLIRDREAEHGGTARIMSIDDYFMQEGEIEEKDPATGKTIKKPSLKYEYDASLEDTYINSLKRAFKRSLTDGYFTFLIFDAVNSTLANYADIWNFARQNGFQVYICSMDSSDVQSCHKRNIHNRKLEDLEVMAARFFPTPLHHIQLDATTLLQSAAITEVQMEDVDEVTMDDIPEAEVESVFTSKWEKMDDANKLARLDGTSKPLRPSHISMDDYLQLDDWTPNKAKPGKKSVRWADIEERRQQEKMRAIGFVVGQTDWNRMTDPTMGSSALTQTKYIERVKRN